MTESAVMIRHLTLSVRRVKILDIKEKRRFRLSKIIKWRHITHAARYKRNAVQWLIVILFLRRRYIRYRYLYGNTVVLKSVDGR